MLVCTVCETPGLKIVARLELGRNGLWDERSIQTARCPSCGAHFHASYQEERRGARERFTHEASPISKALFEKLTIAIKEGNKPEAEALAPSETGEGAHLSFDHSADNPTGRGPLDRLRRWLRN